MVRICVIGGAGYVGLVTAACLADLGHTVSCVDADRSKVDLLSQGVVPFFEEGLADLVARGQVEERLGFTTSLEEGLAGAEIAFICVGTSSQQEGGADLSGVLEVAAKVGRCLDHYFLLAIKSTVPVGTTARVRAILGRRRQEGAGFDIATVPEFLREGSAVEDFFQPSRVVIGAYRPEAAERLRDLYRPLKVPVLLTTPENAEFIKYASNAFLAVKISFVNELANIAEKLGVDITQVARGMGLDRRIGFACTQAGLGFGGPCLGKDLQALISQARKHSYQALLLEAALRVNQKRVEVIVNQLKQALGDLGGKEIGILGLAFKPGTDDLRDSRALELAYRLQQEGARVQVHDPKARAGPGLRWAPTVAALAEGADALVLATEWPDYAEVDWGSLRGLMRKGVFIDGRNLLDPARMRGWGYQYRGVGR